MRRARSGAGQTMLDPAIGEFWFTDGCGPGKYTCPDEVTESGPADRLQVYAFDSDGASGRAHSWAAVRRAGVAITAGQAELYALTRRRSTRITYEVLFDPGRSCSSNGRRRARSTASSSSDWRSPTVQVTPNQSDWAPWHPPTPAWPWSFYEQSMGGVADQPDRRRGRSDGNLGKLGQTDRAADGNGFCVHSICRPAQYTIREVTDQCPDGLMALRPLRPASCSWAACVDLFSGQELVAAILGQTIELPRMARRGADRR